MTKEALDQIGVYVQQIGSKIHVGVKGNSTLTADANTIEDAVDILQRKIQGLVNYKKNVQASGGEMQYS